jgi:DNA-binding XRE family transcriptional regulator
MVEDSEVTEEQQETMPATPAAKKKKATPPKKKAEKKSVSKVRSKVKSNRGPKGWPEEDRVRNGSKKFGARLRAKRKELGWTQAQMGELLGILQPHVSNIEKGTFAPGAKLAGVIEKKFFKSHVAKGKPRKGAPKA